MIKEQTLTTIDKKCIPFTIDTLCVHGDTENAFNILKALHETLTREGVIIRL